ncbi:MAG TPA: Uma2 family endonuclease [Blastocatellia bacterium]|nr:Uma2 family endonuclease [Blastocatellia bacterium]
MSQPVTELITDVDHLVTEDDTPVDNLPSEKQQRLLIEPLYSSWSGPGPGRKFLAAANVGVFYSVRQPAIVPDMFLSLDVEVAPDWWKKQHRSYFAWEFGKMPELVLEIVSNTEGGEDGEKKQSYARMGIVYYVIYDPLRQIMPETLTVYRLQEFSYEKQSEARFPAIKLGLTEWEGEFEGKHDRWLRWTDEHGQIIPTGKERAEIERQRAEAERQRAEAERQRAEAEHHRAEQERKEKEMLLQQLEEERQRAARLAERLRQLGYDPDQQLDA